MEHVHRLIHTKRGTLLVSFVAALAAGAMILVYLNRYRESVKAEGAPVTVLIAARPIPKGTPGSVIASKGLFTATTIRESQLREGALSDPSSLTGKVTAQEIVKGAQLTTSDFAVSADSLVSSLTNYKRIVSIPLDSAHGLIGQIQAGNHVDVYAGFNVIPLGPNGTPISGSTSRAVVKRIMSDVPVMTVGKESSSGSSTTNVSLRLNDKQAAELAFASDNGKVWLALRPAAGAKSSRPGIVTVETLLLGVPPINVVHSLGGGRR
jgi:Flp pilus assembly protein CpaB